MPKAKISRPNIHYNGNIDILLRLLHSHKVVIANRGAKKLFWGQTNAEINENKINETNERCRILVA